MKLSYEQVSDKYIEEQFTYHFASLLKEEQKCKDREALKRLYEKHFPTKKSMASAVEKMLKRCTKHLSADTSESLLPICRLKLERVVELRVQSVLNVLPK